MDIKIKYLNENGSVRIENKVDVREVIVREHLTNSSRKKISIGFTNDYSSGLIEFEPGEFDNLIRELRERKNLDRPKMKIKESRIIRG